ncbi:hypothetical protein ACFV9G_03470 [Nocardioides sp. NPDC059952]|uniref:hypothetical protein n=1 Tax=Nocardioides sp. NPDC059952 TaxID=3347014 RepID=UPI0036604767
MALSVRCRKVALIFELVLMEVRRVETAKVLARVPLATYTAVGADRPAPALIATFVLVRTEHDNFTVALVLLPPTTVDALRVRDDRRGEHAANADSAATTERGTITVTAATTAATTRGRGFTATYFEFRLTTDTGSGGSLLDQVPCGVCIRRYVTDSLKCHQDRAHRFARRRAPDRQRVAEVAMARHHIDTG